MALWEPGRELQRWVEAREGELQQGEAVGELRVSVAGQLEEAGVSCSRVLAWARFLEPSVPRAEVWVPRLWQRGWRELSRWKELRVAERWIQAGWDFGWYTPR